MSNNSYNQSYVSFVEESTPGTTPAAPSMLKFRTTNPLGINFNKALLESEEVFDHRQEEHVRHGLRGIGGTLSSELSYGSFNAFLESLLSGEFSTDVLKPGNTLKTFSIEQKIGASEFLVGLGVAPTQLTLNMNPTGIIQANWELVGMDFSSGGTSLGAPSDVASDPPFDGLGNAAIQEGGASIGIATSIEMTINANKTVGALLGSAGGDTPTDNRLQIDGTMTARFNNLDLFQKFENETESSLRVTLTNPGGAGTLSILLPRLKYTGGQPQNNDGVIDGSFGFKALYDGTTENAAIVITET